MESFPLFCGQRLEHVEALGFAGLQPPTKRLTEL